ncbi:hypothetical protein GTF97_19015 [Roseobacter sp. HKCCD8767]|nr:MULTISPECIES: hypothetical protein [unclassified Roseobacter]NNV31971.1 hypothetical protein [Roseobacter sp. HKCCD9061]NNV36199.1 hypothetical protein [Roseobacter sp. HKCCD9073]NNV44671.1 hypothetical protein [Roseobacter sp. HKCCD6497]NNV95833.1 hypothetical protein [Roseobacter sp. HKCCD8914]NNW12817.1 hypothetical protein [Roseobacter sp. HKCCD8484]NNW17103.1 hypothetical protein [Roseobacter sp. HKCCD8832]NNW21339.1 hypothetical protein [Roseobacter sp. HKCCD7543]NNW29848.1 hypothe
MSQRKPRQITFARLPDVPLDVLIAHTSNPRIAEHMPFLTFAWDREAAARFVATKEECWHRDGLSSSIGLVRSRYRLIP